MIPKITVNNLLTNLVDYTLNTQIPSTIRQYLHNKLLSEIRANFMFKVIAAIKRTPSFCRHSFIIVCGLILVLFFSVSQVKANNDKPLEKVKLQLSWYHQFQFAGYYAAKLKGYYQEEGLEVEIRKCNPNLFPVDAVLSGEADFGTANSDIILLYMQGKPVVVLATIMQHSPWCLLVRADSGITVPEDLIDKTVSTEMSYRDAEFQAMFKYEKISIEEINIILSEPGVKNLINGTVDARASYISDEPYNLQSQGYEPRAIRPVNYGIDFYGDTFFTSELQIREHPQRVAAFRRASLRGWQYAMDHPEEIVDYILSTYYADADPAQAKVIPSREHLLFEAKVMAEDLVHPALIEIGHMNPQRWQRIADTYVDVGMTEPIDTLKGFIYDPSPKANYYWVYWTVGIIAALFLIIGVYATILFIFNKRLHHDVQLRTSENKALVHEVTERKKAEVALQESKQLLSNVFESMQEGVLVLNSDFKYTHFNRTLEEISHTQREEVLGKIPWEKYPFLKGKIEEAIKKTMRGEASREQELKYTLSNGEEGWTTESYFPLRDSEEKIVGVVGVVADITERKKMEEALLQSEKLKSIGTITAGISHEFNNLLAIISGNVQLLERTYNDHEDLTDAFRTIKKATDDGAEICSKMLEFTKTSQDTKKFVSTDIRDLIIQSIDFTKPRWKNEAQAKGINYKMDTESVKSVSPILCNPTELREVFINLIINALDAMPEGGSLSFSTWSGDDTVLVAVSDTGEGMSNEVMKNIFDPFFTTKTPVGTGLGMSMVYGIMTRHGGKIEVESEGGKGSMFKLQFPITTDTVCSIATPQPEKEIKNMDLCILVVDDEEAICNILDTFLSSAGHKVKTVDNGADAINIIKTENFDLVLCDLVMPDVFGYDVIKAFNEQEKRPKIGIITGWGEKLKPIEEGIKVDFIIKKPFDLLVLRKQINDVFDAI